MKSSKEEIHSYPIPRGVYAASLTPMFEDLSCNHDALSRHCLDMIERGCRGVVVFGSTGEGPSFSMDERISALKLLIASGIDPMNVIVCVSSTSFKEAVQLITAAIELNCLSVMVTPPFFYKGISEEGVCLYYKEILQHIDSPDLKMILYHIPKLSGVPITLKVIETLLDAYPGLVVGIKESEGNLALTQEILTRFPKFQVFLGNESQITEGVKIGASGCISGICNAIPELICSLYENRGNNEQEAIEKLIDALSKFPIFPAIKYMVELQKGSDWKKMRPPLAPLTEQQIKSLLSKITL